MDHESEASHESTHSHESHRSAHSDSSTAAHGEGGDENIDQCVRWLSKYVMREMNIKKDKWKKMMMISECRYAVHNFMEETSLKWIVFFTVNSDLFAAIKYPPEIKRKALYVMKDAAAPARLASEDLDRFITSGDLAPAPLDQLSAVVNEVYAPLLKNRGNHKAWPRVVEEDVLRHFHKLSGAVYVVSGLTVSKTLLPLPPDAEGTETSAQDKTLVHQIESAVIEWTHQVRGVVKSSNADVLTRAAAQRTFVGPLAELQFWHAKATDLKCIHDQLYDEKMRKIGRVLDISRSSYFPALQAMYAEVDTALTEAYDIDKCLSPLRKHVEAMAELSTYTQIVVCLKCVLSTLVLAWKASRYYTAAHLVVLLQQLCNDLIRQTQAYVGGERLFQIETVEAVEALEVALEVLSRFRAAFAAAKNDVNTTVPERGWTFDSHTVFERLNQFTDRLTDLLDLMRTILEFNKLEKVEIGGSKGDILTTNVVDVFKEFADAVQVFSQIEYDALDIQEARYVAHAAGFRAKIADLERRISTVISDGFDDAVTVSAAFKLLDSFHGMLHRTAIRADFVKKYDLLLDAYAADLEAVHALFLAEKDGPPIHRNLPHVSGCVMWARALFKRIERPHRKLMKLDPEVLETAHAQRVLAKYDHLVEELHRFESERHLEWIATVDAEATENLNLNLLSRDADTKKLAVNFDPALVRLLREIRYLKDYELEVPEAGEVLFADETRFRRHIQALDLIVVTYNRVVATLIAVEVPLLEDRLTRLDQSLEQGIRVLTWRSEGIDSFISAVLDATLEVDRILRTLKENVEELQYIVRHWSHRPLVDRKGADTRKPMAVADAHAQILARSLEIELQGGKLHSLLAESLEAAQADETSPAWIDYVAYFNDIVKGGFHETVRASLAMLLSNMSDDYLRRNELAPLFEARLLLQDRDLAFDPPMLAAGAAADLKTTFMDLMNSFTKIGKLVKRVDSGKAGKKDTYFQFLSEDPALRALRNEVIDNVNSIVQDCLHYKNNFLEFADLWQLERQDVMEAFLTYGPDMNLRDEELLEGEIEEHPPALEDFAKQIQRYTAALDSVAEIPETATFHWLRVSAKPFKTALANLIRKWRLMFTDHLYEDVVSSLKGLDDFIRATNVGLSKEVKAGDYAALVDTMGVLRDVRARIEETDGMFKPLHEKILMLRENDVEVPSSVVDLLNDLPQQWTGLKRSMFAVRDKLTPLQQVEVAKIKKRREMFTKEVTKYRTAFEPRAPKDWKLSQEQAYIGIDQLSGDLLELTQTAVDLADQEELFELTVTGYKELPDSKKDLMHLKALWDMIALIRYQFQEWRETLWQQIDTDAMDADCKQFLKQIRALPRETKRWDARNGLDVYLKNLLKSLRSISDLRDPALRSRHWDALMRETGVRIDMKGDIYLKDLLALELHKYEEVVSEIVDRAQKELRMEKQLAEIEAVWQGLAFVFEPHRDGTPLLKPADELVETLEENMVRLQNMMSAKSVAYFLEKIELWLGRLSNVDTVLNLWLEVQRTWRHMESIFIGSQDIRTQLPDDAVRFDRIDAAWKALMHDAAATPNVVAACAADGRLDQLRKLEADLELCAKALEQYLETKRLAFPRFYFISVSDLLDILSKGNDARAIMQHIPKLFDNLGSLIFENDTSLSATFLVSQEGERVAITHPVVCSGQVEVWLNALIDSMRKSLHARLAQAYHAYEDSARETWLTEYPAQIALAGSQIHFAQDVDQSFERLVDGYDSALKDCLKKVVSQLQALIHMLQGKLDRLTRKSIMTICTYDTHSRDVLKDIIADKRVENRMAFAWQSQLRLRWDDDKNDCFLNICDAEFQYQYEYLGNSARLVITPLTDRCYITLTQSLRLIMGGSPAGPAGTGKTETTKDLGRVMGIRVLVQNCSPQQTYLDLANIFKGLAQAGMWGCFDEFNRISIEVLSVVSTQVKCILDAIKGRKARFMFINDEIALVRTVGLFITMNPGYAGRTELPDNLKSLFRPVSMVVPDFDRICEIMLIAEGFETAENLALKFTTLYSLTAELLSKQKHYDWGLRAIKSVLVVAGPLKRADPELSEDAVLMRALRDFNLPKIVYEDVAVFMNLINDLFPAMTLERKADEAFEKTIADVVVAKGLQPEPTFILKVVQLKEILDVRHSVYIIGPGGCGKTQVWKTLAETWTKQGNKTLVRDISPKAVTTNELYGFTNPVTKELTDGLFSKTMRTFSDMQDENPKWILLDGDIDPDWIESLNTVMDDNKILTLPSNERIQLKAHMRLVFEVGHLKHATPATVSRAGILYINESDLGWGPYHISWIASRANVGEVSNLTVLFDKYVAPALEYVNKNLKHMVPISNFAMVQALCAILDGLLTPENVPAGSDKELYECYFCFACAWAIGGALLNDGATKHADDFSIFFKGECRAVKFPTTGSIFDYRLDKAGKWVPWADALEPYVHDADLPVSRIFVATPETVRLKFFLDLFVRTGKPVMLVGGPGSGKSMLIRHLLSGLDDNEFMHIGINFNYYTDSAMLQAILDSPLERKMRKDYGPPGMKKLVYFVDDFNMPALDKYDTQMPHTLIRQHIDHGHWYDRSKWEVRNILRCQYVAAMNPSSGTFTIDPRLQRHFGTFAVAYPQKDALTRIYKSILTAHLEEFRGGVNTMAGPVVEALFALHTSVVNSFFPTAIKFHYQFNLRDLAGIVQGLLAARREVFREPLDVARLVAHECRRNYADRLTSDEESDRFETFLAESLRKNLVEYKLKDADVFVSPLIFAHFAGGVGDTTYNRIPDFKSLNAILADGLEQYNELNAAMDLVLFDDAMEHVTRISRIIMSGGGNALLVGVGGSGKQSLARLAASINTFEVFQIQIKQNYGTAELRQDLVTLYMKAGVRGDDIVFLLTDTQIVSERFLIYINDLLSSGDIPDLFSPEEKTNILASVRAEVKQAGIVDTPDNCWAFFIAKVQRHLHMILCFSPVGDTFRDRYRKFPALVNNCSIDWFHPWPADALVSVAQYFLRDVDMPSEDIKRAVVLFMAECHSSVERASIKFRDVYRRYNYTTPKSFLELIKLYSSMLAAKRDGLASERQRLVQGLDRLFGAADQVAKLHMQLADERVVLEEKSRVTQQLVEQLATDTKAVEAQRAVAEEEEAKTNVVAQEVAVRRQACDEDLKKAEPALIAADEALKSFTRDDIVFVRSLPSPPAPVVRVLAAVLILQSPPGRLRRDVKWDAAQKAMKDVNRFMESLGVGFDKDNIPRENLVELERKYLNDPSFTPELMRSKSIAAAGLCSWVINIVEYHKIYVVVQPKRDALKEATDQLALAEQKLEQVKRRVAQLNRNLEDLTAKFERANADKLEMERRAQATALTIQLADRLILGLAGEKVRWTAEVEHLKALEGTLVGDVLAAAAFISYIGAFNRPLREELVKVQWLPWLVEHGVPLSADYDPLRVLTNDAQVAQWNNEGLPTDRVSLENAAICCNCERWPLIVDPQQQAVRWLKARSDCAGMKLLQTNQDRYLDTLLGQIEDGGAVLIENIKPNMDPMLDPVLARNYIRRQNQLLIVVGGTEKVVNRAFRLFLVSKEGNPHFRPEIQAQATLINFTVTEDGLEDQLLATVVKSERPDLEAQRAELIRQQNEFEIRLKELESSLLHKLQEADGDFLSDTVLVENLESTKALADDITAKKKVAIATGESINTTRNRFRAVAARGSLLYFLLNDLSTIDLMYQYSLEAFAFVFEKAMAKAEPSEDIEARVALLTNAITLSVFSYAARGLFERHKLIVTTMLCFRILTAAGTVDPEELEFLVRAKAADTKSPIEWINAKQWGLVKELSKLKAFKRLADDIEGSAARWRKWTEEPYPEDVPMPQDWKSKAPVQQLCVLRCLRPDRMIQALKAFITASPALGEAFVNFKHEPLWTTFEESSPAVPLFFILSPGYDPLKDVESLGRKKGYTLDNKKLESISLGQGQDTRAMEALERARVNGTWVLLSNIHLMTGWLPELEKKMEGMAVGADPNFRLFLSAEPSGDPTRQIPVPILQASVKLVNEPPSGMRASVLRAFDNFDQEALERSSKETEFHAIVFALCFFHAQVLERRKFGPTGFNISYPFNSGDLTVSASVAVNLLEINVRVPWEDLKYLFGEILYGGHVSDDRDRRLVRTYLDQFMREELVSGDLALTEGFGVPPHGSFESYRAYIEDALPAESPAMFGLARNAESGFLTTQADELFRTILNLQPQIGVAGRAESREERVQTLMAEILESVTDDTLFNMVELYISAEDKMDDPYVVVALQEADRLNGLLREILRSLRELDEGIRGNLVMTSAMEELLVQLFLNKVPASWERLAYPSLAPLSVWFSELVQRVRQIQRWTSTMKLPVTVNCAWLYNPQSLLTAIMQATARKNGLPLDSMCLVTEVTKRSKEEVSTARLEGAYVYGMFLEGARWDTQGSQLAEAGAEVHQEMPVIYLRAVTKDRFDDKGYYSCPLYKTRRRGPTFVWYLHLRTKLPAAKWVLSGTALLLSVD